MICFRFSHIICTGWPILISILPVFPPFVWFYDLCLRYSLCLVAGSFRVYRCLYCFCLCLFSPWKHTLSKLVIHLSRSIHLVSCLNHSFPISVPLNSFSLDNSLICRYFSFWIWIVIVLLDSLAFVNLRRQGICLNSFLYFSRGNDLGCVSRRVLLSHQWLSSFRLTHNRVIPIDLCDSILDCYWLVNGFLRMLLSQNSWLVNNTILQLMLNWLIIYYWLLLNLLNWNSLFNHCLSLWRMHNIW